MPGLKTQENLIEATRSYTGYGQDLILFRSFAISASQVQNFINVFQ